MRHLSLGPSEEYECIAEPCQFISRWQWTWQVRYDGEVVRRGGANRLRQAEKRAERAAMEHKMEVKRAERAAQQAAVARNGKRWTPWL